MQVSILVYPWPIKVCPISNSTNHGVVIKIKCRAILPFILKTIQCLADSDTYVPFEIS